MYLKIIYFLFFVIEPLDKRENECINPCPGQYLSENNCQNCHPSCGSCFGPNGNHCLKCSGNFSLNTESHTCNKACPRKFYQDPKTFTCKPCHYSCASCFGPTSSQCLTCPEKLQFHSNTCVWHCPYGWYKTFGQQCAPCSPRCKKCLYKYDLCTNCHQNDVWHDFKCFKKCGENMFHDSSNRCYPCHESCKTCNGTAPNECLTCPDGSTLHNNMCIEGCLSGHYYNTKKEVCLPCKKDCLKCKGNLFMIYLVAHELSSFCEKTVKFSKMLSSDCIMWKEVYNNFTNFTGKHLCWSLFLIKLLAFRPGTLFKETPTPVFSSEICKIFKNTYFEEHLRTTASVFSKFWENELTQVTAQEWNFAVRISVVVLNSIHKHIWK